MSTSTDIWTTWSDSGDVGSSTAPDRWASGESHAADARAGNDAARQARILGMLGIGVGLAEVVVPRRVARAIGVPDRFAVRTLLRALGLREIASGAAILTGSRPASGVWGRVAGDSLDLALLRRAMTAKDVSLWRLALTTAAVAAVTAIDATCAARLDQGQPGANGKPSASETEVRARAGITVNAPLHRVFLVWEGFAGLPRFMRDLARVEITGDRTSRWTMNLPGGIEWRWDVEIVETVPDHRIGWRATSLAGLGANGEVRFRRAPGDRGTELLFTARLRPPGGELALRAAGPGAAVISQKMRNDLRRCKQLIELGEIVHSDDSLVPGPNPAQPRA